MNFLNPKYHLLYLAALLSLACSPTIKTNEESHSSNIADVTRSTSSSDNLIFYAVVEIPAGTNKKVEIDKETEEFRVDQRDGKDRIISFLPYPANYGFIAGTLSDAAEGGDGDAVDVLVIAEQLKTGTVISVEPIAMLKLIDDGEEDFKVLAVPTDDRLNVLKLTDLKDDPKKEQAIKEIIEKWFLSYDSDPAKVIGWADKAETLQYIKNNQKK